MDEVCYTAGMERCSTNRHETHRYRFLVALGVLAVLLVGIAGPIVPTLCGGGLQVTLGPSGPMCHDHAMAGGVDAGPVLFGVLTPGRIELFLACLLLLIRLLPPVRSHSRTLPAAIVMRRRFLRWFWRDTRHTYRPRVFAPTYARVEAIT